MRRLVEDGRDRVVPQSLLAVGVETSECPPVRGPYLLGPMDVIDVQFIGNPDFGSEPRMRGTRGVGYRIQEDGRVFLPILGSIPAAGRTVIDVQADLAARMAEFVEHPGLSVDVISYESQKFYVLGAVGQPGVFPVRAQTRLLDGIGLAGGIREGGDIEGAFVVRGSALLPVSLGDILLRGDTSRNILMRDGDLVYVPPAVRWEVYVLGEVVRPGRVQMPQTGLSLVAALSAAGGLDPVHADQNVIRVFRGSWQAPQVFTLSAEDVYRCGDQIELKPGDRIQVAPRRLATWSRTLGLLTPFLQTAVTGAAAGAAISR